jgi:thiol-disulfide isomerase/thioredoxin
MRKHLEAHMNKHLHEQHTGSHTLEPSTDRTGDRAEGAAPSDPVAVGQKVPDFSVVDLSGTKVTLAQIQKDAKRMEKSVVVLSFWCSFCGSCRKVEGPLNKLQKQYEDRAVVIALDASAGETADKVRAFTRRNGLDLTVLLDPTGRTADVFGTRVTTTTVVLDGAGVLCYRGQFADREHAYAEEALREVLAGKDVRIKTTPLQGCPIPRDWPR